MKTHDTGDLVVRELAWDTRHFGIRMGVLEAPDSKRGFDAAEAAALVRAAVAQARTLGYRQLTARAGPWDTAWIHALEASGFQLVDTLVTWELLLTEALGSHSGSAAVQIRTAAEADAPALKAIAKRAFADRSIWLDRFHADPRIPVERADALYETWVQNSVAPSTPGDAMADMTLTAEVGGVLAGFLTGRVVRTALELVGQVSLNAVEAAYRGRGVYRALVEASLRWFAEQGCRRVRVRTGLASHPIHRTWQRLGAIMVMEEHTFHWWGAA